QELVAVSRLGVDDGAVVLDDLLQITVERGHVRLDRPDAALDEIRGEPEPARILIAHLATRTVARSAVRAGFASVALDDRFLGRNGSQLVEGRLQLLEPR